MTEKGNPINPDESQIQRVAFYGGSFDPVHSGHIAIGERLLSLFKFDAFVFIPAFHAPHKTERKPTPAIDRFAMLCLATTFDQRLRVSKIEIELPEKPYAIETLGRLKTLLPDTRIFFVMGADSWTDIRTWREWEAVLGSVDHIVVTRPGFEISTSHVTDDLRNRIVDLRGQKYAVDIFENLASGNSAKHIFFSDAVKMDISSSGIRQAIRSGDPAWKDDLPQEVAKYIEKYQIYR